MKQAILFIMLLGFIYPAGASDLVFSASSDTTWQWYCNGKLLQGETNATLKGTGRGGVFNYKRKAIVDGKVAGEFNITLNVPNSPSKPTPDPPVDTFIITNEAVLRNVVSGGGTYTLGILVSDSWKVSSCPDWVTVTPSSGGAGKDIQSVEVKVNANTGSADRSGQVVFERKDKQAFSVAVTQKGKVLADALAFVDADGLKNVPAEGGTVNVKILSSGPWTFDGNIHAIATPSSGQGSEEPQPVAIQVVRSNQNYLQSSFLIYLIRNDNKRISLRVYQDPKPLGDDFFIITDDQGAVSGTVDLSYCYASKYAYIFSSGAWKYVSGPNWLTASLQSGIGDRKGESVQFKAPDHLKADSRNGQIVLRRNEDGKTLKVTVVQSARNGLFMGDNNVSELHEGFYYVYSRIPKEGQTFILTWNDKTGIKYNFSIDEPWISCVSDKDRYVNEWGDKIKVTAEPNTTGEYRKWIFTLTGSDGKVIKYGFEQSKY